MQLSLSDNASLISARLSVFEDAPDSPESWRFGSSLLKPLNGTGLLEARLQEFNITTTHNPNPPQANEPRTMRFPALPEIPMSPRISMGNKKNTNMPVNLTRSQSKTKTKTKTKSKSKSKSKSKLARGQGLERATSFLDLQLQNLPVKRSILNSTVLRGSSISLALHSFNGPNERLKIKVMCPDEDEILAIKIHKDKLRSVRELADVISIKLNIRYCIRPDDLECRLIFPNKSLPPVDLGSGDLDGFLEDFIMEYIQTRLKIYIEARLKAGRKKGNKVTFTEPEIGA